MNKHSTRDMETRWLADWDHSHDRRNTIKISARICTAHKKLASTSLVDWQAGGCMVCSVCSHVVGSYADGWQILDRFKCRWQIVSWLGRLIECFNRFEAALIARDCLSTHWSNQPITVQILDLPVLTSSCSGDTLNTKGFTLQAFILIFADIFMLIECQHTNFTCQITRLVSFRYYEKYFASSLCYFQFSWIFISTYTCGDKKCVQNFNLKSWKEYTMFDTSCSRGEKRCRGSEINSARGCALDSFW